MYNTLDFTTQFAVDSKNTRTTIGFTFNGETVAVSGFSNATSGAGGGVLGSCFKVVTLPDIVDNTFPRQSQTLQRPLAVDLLYRFTEQDVVLMESNNTSIMYAAYTLGVQASTPVNVSSSAVLIACGPKTLPDIERSAFDGMLDYKVVNNTSAETHYPIEISYALFKVLSNSPIVLPEWPLTTPVTDVSELIYESCSTSTVVKNDSIPTLNKVGSYNGILLTVTLKDNLKAILDSHFTVTQDMFFRIIVNPIFVTHTSVKGKSRLLYPFAATPVEDLTHIVFTSVESTLSSPTHYRIILKANNAIIMEGASTGEYWYDSTLEMNPDISPFRFFYGDTSRLTPLQTGQIRYDGNHDPNSGAPKNGGANIVVEINENLAFKLRKYNTISVEVYANDGTRNYRTNLWSIQ